jgi:hypothetical protein
VTPVAFEAEPEATSLEAETEAPAVEAEPEAAPGARPAVVVSSVTIKAAPALAAASMVVTVVSKTGIGAANGKDGGRQNGPNQAFHGLSPVEGVE